MTDFDEVIDMIGEGLSAAGIGDITDTISGIIAFVIPLVITLAVLLVLWLTAPPILNKIKENRVCGKIRSGEEIPAVLHGYINKKKYVPDELLQKLLRNAEKYELSWTECSNYMRVLQSRARLKHYIDRRLCMMLEIRRCRSYIINIQGRAWHITQKKNRLTRLVSYRGHFYIKSGEIVLKVDEKTYEAVINNKALVVAFEFEKGTRIEVFALCQKALNTTAQSGPN